MHSCACVTKEYQHTTCINYVRVTEIHIGFVPALLCTAI
jgi:hypothetical protein